MTSIDAIQTAAEMPRAGFDKVSATQRVNMANPEVLRDIFAGATGHEGPDAPQRDELSLGDPYREADLASWSGQGVSDGSGTAGSGSAGSLSNSLETEIQQIETGLKQISTDLTELLNDLQSIESELGINTSPTGTASGAKGNSEGSCSSSGSDSGSSCPSSGCDSSPTGSATSASTGSDSGDDGGSDAPVAAASPGAAAAAPAASSDSGDDGSDGGDDSGDDGGDDASAPVTSTPSDSPAPAPVTSTPSEAPPPKSPVSPQPIISSPSKGGGNMTAPGSKPTSSDPFIANLQLADPVLAKVMTDASTNMSSAGYKALESAVQKQVAGNTNWNSGNPNFDASVMKNALTKTGLSTADQATLTSTLQKDMPAALASDPFAASIQTSDPAMAKVMSDAKNDMSASGYQTFEGWVQTNYTGNPSESAPAPNQAFLDSVVMNSALHASGIDSADDAQLDNVLQKDMPGATSSDLLVSTLQSTDPKLAKVVGDASGALSKAGYGQLESYIEENSTWNASNDGSLLNSALSQAGLTSSDSGALSGVLQNDMPAALTDTPSAAVQAEMAQAKFNYENEYSLKALNHPSAISGNPGKSGDDGANDDQEPADITKIGPWDVVAPIDPNNYNKDAKVTVSDPSVYFHLKTGGWVEALSPSQAGSSWWEGNYNNTFTANQPGDGQVNSDGSYSFTAPPSNLIDHFGTTTLAYNPSLYDGVYETINAKTDVANSGLAMNVGDDYYVSDAAPGAIRGATQSNWVPLTTSGQTLYLTDMSPSAIEGDPPPGLSA